jgi:hypothetical protein
MKEQGELPPFSRQILLTSRQLFHTSLPLRDESLCKSFGSPW